MKENLSCNVHADKQLAFIFTHAMLSSAVKMQNFQRLHKLFENVRKRRPEKKRKKKKAPEGAIKEHKLEKQGKVNGETSRLS